MTWVEDQIYAAGGDHLPKAWADFTAQTGISTVVHQRSAAPAAFIGPAPQAFLWLDLTEEGQADLELRWQAGTFVHQQVQAGRRVLLHASQGRHRTRWIYVAYRLCSGQDLAKALHQAEKRPWLAPYHTDRRAWEAFVEHVQQQRRGQTAWSGGGADAV